MPGNTSHTFFDQLVEVIEKAQREAQAGQRASQADVEKARREMAREKMEKERMEAEEKRAEKEAAEKKAAKNGNIQVEDLDASESPLGEKFDARKMVIYSEIMNPKYKD